MLNALLGGGWVGGHNYTIPGAIGKPGWPHLHRISTNNVTEGAHNVTLRRGRRVVRLGCLPRTHSNDFNECE